MKEIERRAFNMRCDDIGLSVQSCALKAAVAFDDQETYRANVSREARRSVFDAIQEPEHRAGANLFFAGASASSGNVVLECDTCDQRLKIHNRYASGDSKYTIDTDFPLKCLAYASERIKDIESVQSVRISQDQAREQRSS